MTAPWPCDDCGAPGVRNVFARGYCVAHLTELYRRFDTAVWGFNGIGLPTGPDLGDGFYDLACVACDAGWVGAAFTPCPWCQRKLAEILEKAS